MPNKLAFIVEDNTLLSNLLARALSDVDIDTLILKDGRQAMETLKEKAPDLLFLDLHLPYISGDQILDEIHADPRFGRTYIVLITADARLGDMKAGKADFLLNKPIDILQLQQLAERLKNGKKGK
jgi:two-component system, cell cycle response regulator DivK